MWQKYKNTSNWAQALGFLLVGQTAVLICGGYSCQNSLYSELFTNPFLAWGKYRRKFFKTTLPISFQFHHAQMDGFEAARFLNELQKVMDRLKV